MKKLNDLKSEHTKPSSCKECGNLGISELTVFPSLCKRNYLWFECGGKFGYKQEGNIITLNDIMNMNKEKEREKIE